MAAQTSYSLSASAKDLGQKLLCDVDCLMQEIPELAGVAAYWVNSAACVDVARNKVTHKLAHGELIETQPWLKDGPITIGAPPPVTTPPPPSCLIPSCSASTAHYCRRRKA